MRYEAVIRNLTFGQAQALYAVMVNVDPSEIHGVKGMSWSGVASEPRDGREPQIITIQPMVGELDAAIREREADR